MLKNLIFISVSSVLLLSASSASACTLDTISDIVRKVDPFQTSQVAGSMNNAVRVLGLCDENLYHAGFTLGERFNVFQSTSTQRMVTTVLSLSAQMHPELRQGLAMGMIEQVNLFQNSSQWIMKGIYELAAADPSFAKQAALGLMKKSNSFQTTNDNYLKKTVDALISLTQVQVPTMPVGSIWAFRSENRVCQTFSGPWGLYYECPQYSASVVDMKGNRIVLTCASNQAGIEMQIRFASDAWSQIDFQTISGIAFGTNSIQQAMGIPYYIPEQRSFIIEEVLSAELQAALQKDQTLAIKVRSNSGESVYNMSVPLSGSNVAISKLRSVCQ